MTIASAAVETVTEVITELRKYSAIVGPFYEDDVCYDAGPDVVKCEIGH